MVVPVDPELSKVQLRGDEMYMYLKIGDATLRGNVRRTGFAEPVAYPSRKVIMPPDIIK